MIFAIDPGPKKSAYVEYEDTKILEHGHIDNYALRIVLHNSLSDILAIEYPFVFGRPVYQPIIDTACEIGRFIESVSARIKHVYAIDPIKWRMFICGKRNVKDKEIRDTLALGFGHKGTKKSPGVLYGFSVHELDALCIAMYAERVSRHCDLLNGTKIQT
jgi:hypothetical protein